MLVVALIVDVHPIMHFSVVKTGEKNDAGETLYSTGNGVIIAHNPEDGAIDLAIKLLQVEKNK